MVVERQVDPVVSRLMSETAAKARESGQFASVEPGEARVHCTSARRPDAGFRIEYDGGLWVAWVSPDRYLSQSIEADLMWTGDDLDDLIAEELADQGFDGALGPNEHFRSEEKLFTFRSRIPREPAHATADDLVKCLSAYQAAFSELGDMKR